MLNFTFMVVASVMCIAYGFNQQIVWQGHYKVEANPRGYSNT